MATNSVNQPNNGNGLPENITLRIVILAHGNRAEDDLFLVLNLDTTINQLKQRIQESLAQHPHPENQRLIYQGRALTEGNVPLRQILRVDPRVGSPSHVIHLVVRDPAAAVQAPPAVPVATLPQQPPPQQHLPRPIPLGQNAHMALHERLHNMQHQLHHAQALRASQPRPPPQQVAPQITQVQSGSQPLGQVPIQGPSGMPIPNSPYPSHPHVSGQMTRIEERIGPNGEHVRTVIDSNGSSSSTTMTFRMAGLNVPNPLERPLSAPGTSPQAAAEAANRAGDQMPRNIHVHAPVPHVPAGFPFPPGMQLPPPMPSLYATPMQNIVRPPPSQTMAWILSSPQGPQGIVFAPGHGFFTTATNSTPAEATTLQPTPTIPSTAQQPTATVNAPRPQAQLVVRPQDGLAEIVRPDQPAPPQPGAVPQPVPAARARQQQRPRLEDNDLVQWFMARAWLFMRMYIFIFVFSESGSWRRFILLTSAIVYCLLPDRNPLTNALTAARRHFDNLIGPPDLPQRPAQPQDQAQVADVPAEQTATQRATAQSQQPASSTGPRRQQQRMPTPEEAARRLLQQQNRRNPNPVVDFLYRVEQGVVLFLASLVPGLGERHVQVREEARRILEDEERRVREERERQNADGESATSPDNSSSAQNANTNEPKRETGPLPESWGTQGLPGSINGEAGSSINGQASSSGIDRSSAQDSALRSRSGNS